MKIEVGKTYLTRSGHKAVIKEYTDYLSYPFGGKIIAEDCEYFERWTKAGFLFISERQEGNDLVSEFVSINDEQQSLPVKVNESEILEILKDINSSLRLLVERLTEE